MLAERSSATPDPWDVGEQRCAQPIGHWQGGVDPGYWRDPRVRQSRV